jgi:hypothetical protein
MLAAPEAALPIGAAVLAATPARAIFPAILVWEGPPVFVQERSRVRGKRFLVLD